MPALSMFYGIVVRMFAEEGGKYNMPHIYAMYSGENIVVSLSGEVLEGGIPANKMKLLLAWMEIHNEELLANWQLLEEREPVFKIEPLK